MKPHIHLALKVVIVALLALTPLFADSYTQYVLNLVLAYVVIAIGLNIVMGFAGQLSFAHSAFMAIGAYGTVLLMNWMSLSFVPALLISGLLTSAFGFVVGLPAVRVRGLYLALLTIALLYFVRWALVHGESVTKGSSGLQMPPVDVFGFAVAGDKGKFFVVLPITLVMMWLATFVVRSKWGRSFVFARDAEIAAQACGINVMMAKATAFAISAFYAAVGGGLYALTVDFLVPNSFGLLQMMTQFAMVLVGGLASIAGAVIGAVVIGILPELLRELRGAQEIAYGLVILGCVLFMPEGIVGLLRKWHWLAPPILLNARREWLKDKPATETGRVGKPVSLPAER